MIPSEMKLLVAFGYATEEGDCWRWNRGHQSRGYGQVNGGELVHRAVYRALVGEIPEGYEVDHLCFVKDCINVEHLEAVPQSVNRQRAQGRHAAAMEKRRATMLAKTTCRKGHPHSPENTRIDTRGARVCKTCARDNAAKYRKKAA